MWQFFYSRRQIVDRLIKLFYGEQIFIRNFRSTGRSVKFTRYHRKFGNPLTRALGMMTQYETT